MTDINNTSACVYTMKDAAQHGLDASIGVDFRNPVYSGVEQQYIAIARNNEGFREITQHLDLHIHSNLDFHNRAPHFDNVVVVYPLENCWNDKSTIGFSDLKEYEYVGVRPEQLSRLHLSPWYSHQHKLVVLQSASFRNKKDFNAHRLLRAIDNNLLLSQLPASKQGNINEQFRSVDELMSHFKEFPVIISNTRKILEECKVDFEFGKKKNKNPFFSSIAEDNEQLRNEAYSQLPYRYGKNPPQTVLQRLEKELQMIKQLEFCSYFLINWDMIRYAQSKDYYYVGRGSGANSVVAYLLRITDVDPVELDLYFERFINPYRTSPPDFDIDFNWTDRDDITQYLFRKHDNIALVGTYSTFKHRSIFRELSKVFGLPDQDIKKFQNNPREALNDDYGRYVVHYSNYLAGFPSHLSVHASGILISQKSINHYCGTFMPPKGFPTTQFNMHVAEDVGLHKFDVLSQRGLGKIKDSLEIIHQNKGDEVDIHNVKKFKEDPLVKNLLKKGDAIGCFYIESPAMRMLLTKLEAEDYLRLVAASSIIRPGVAQSGMMREYILRFQDEERRNAAREELPEFYSLMEETFGVMVYQEDVIKVAHHFADLSLEEADVLRRGMSWSFRQRNDFRIVKDKFFENCEKKGHPKHLVAQIWEQIETFANYAFAKGHSASYAIESFQALYLKAYYPLEYMVATLNNGGGFYRTELYLHEARLHGGIVEAPCINNSDYLSIIYEKTIYLGLRFIHGLERTIIKSVLTDRTQNGSFKNLRDFVKRVPISLEQTLLIIRAGGFRFTGRDKKQLLWDAHFLLGHNKKTKPSANLFDVEVKSFNLPVLWYHELEEAFDQMELFGFPLSDPFRLLKDELPSMLLASDLKNKIGEEVEIVGYLVHRKHTSTKQGASMNFGVFLDLEGRWIDSVHFPEIARRFPFKGPGCYLIKGVITEEFGFIAIETKELHRLDNANMDAPSARLKIQETQD